jgi:hypothetical protein
MNIIQEEINKLTDGLFHKKSIDDELKKFSDLIFNNIQISTSKSAYRISEIEYYILTQFHPDPYSYMHNIQNEDGIRLFFHYSSIDLVFNNKIHNQDGYASFIIREIVDLKSLEAINGPLKLKDIILNAGTENFCSKIELKYTESSEKNFKSDEGSTRIGLQKEITKRQKLIMSKLFEYNDLLKTEYSKAKYNFKSFSTSK